MNRVSRRVVFRVFTHRSNAMPSVTPILRYGGPGPAPCGAL